jgi:hypothetical protein
MQQAPPCVCEEAPHAGAAPAQSNLLRLIRPAVAGVAVAVRRTTARRGDC